MLNHQGTQVLTTARLTLRPFIADDAPAMFANWTGDGEVTKFLTWQTHASVEATAGFVNYLLDAYEKPESYSWGIAWKENEEELFGMISVVNINEEADGMEIGYCLGKNWWGRGVMTEALRTVIGFCIETVGAQRVSARHDTKNPASGAVMRKAGMTFEGVLRRADRNNQGICDAAYYSILNDEYQSNADR